jgi:hypothetical protein
MDMGLLHSYVLQGTAERLARTLMGRSDLKRSLAVTKVKGTLDIIIFTDRFVFKPVYVSTDLATSAHRNAH